MKIERNTFPAEIEDLLLADVQIYGKVAIEKEITEVGFDNVNERLKTILSSEEDTPTLQDTFEIIREFLQEVNT